SPRRCARAPPPRPHRADPPAPTRRRPPRRPDRRTTVPARSCHSPLALRRRPYHRGGAPRISCPMILVTGGAGFIGSNLHAALARRGLETIVVDRLGDQGKWRNLAHHPPSRIIQPERLDDF